MNTMLASDSSLITPGEYATFETAQFYYRGRVKAVAPHAVRLVVDGRSVNYDISEPKFVAYASPPDMILSWAMVKLVVIHAEGVGQ